MATRSSKATPTPWTFSVGQRARPHRVTVYENTQRGGVLSLRWYVETHDGRKPKSESLGKRLRTADGKIVRETERWAKAQAQAKHQALLRGEGTTADPSVDAAPLTIGEAKAKITDPKQGRYPKKSAHRRETENALDFACTVWGGERTWDTIRKGDLRALGRARVDQLRKLGHDGLAGAEHTVQRVLTVAQWLRDEELIEPGACVPGKNWKEELRAYWLEVSERHELPKPHRPRYTINEALKIIEASATVDPRLHLMLSLAPNQRLGQVARTHRSNVHLETNDVRIPSRGKKKGAAIVMTAGERQVLDDALATGYLRLLEAAYLAGEIADYPLFPAGQMPGARVLRRGTPSESKWPSWRPPETPTATVERHATAGFIEPKTIQDWFKAAEAKAEITSVKGRGPYGVRRAFVDAGKKAKISREGLTALGGWSDPQMADRVYAEDEQRYAQEEARDVRARIRGESTGAFTETPAPSANNEPGENDKKLQQSSNTANPEADGV